VSVIVLPPCALSPTAPQRVPVLPEICAPPVGLSPLHAVQRQEPAEGDDGGRGASAEGLPDREDNRTAVVDGIAVGLDGIGDMFRGLLQDIEERERTITLGLSASDPRFRTTVPDLFVDQCNRHDVDFFFADVPSNGFSEL
jgi:hypothetical protein